MSPDMAGFGFGFENRPVRGPGLQKYGNTSIPVFPKPSRRALAPGFGALENQPAIKLGFANSKHAHQKYGNTSIPVFPKPSRRALAPGFSALENQPAIKHGFANSKHAHQKYGNTSIPVFPKPSRRALAPGFGAFENQPEASAKSARQTGHKTRFRQLKTRPSEIRKYRYSRISEITGNALKQAIQVRGHRLKNAPVRNTEIPVFPYFRKPGRRALAPGFGALENQPEASAKSARQTGHKTRFRPTQNTPVRNTEIPVFPYFRNRRKHFETRLSGQRHRLKNASARNTEIPVFPYFRNPVPQRFRNSPRQTRSAKNNTPPIEQKHASICSKYSRHEFYHPTSENRA